MDNSSRGYRGRKNRRKAMMEGIENAVSQAMTGDNPTDKMYNQRSLMGKIKEKLQDTADESARRYIETPVQKKQYGGKVRAMKCGGAVMHGRGPKFKGSR